MDSDALHRWLRTGYAELGFGAALLVAGFVALVGELFLPGVPDLVWALQVAVWLGLGGAATWSVTHRSTPAPGGPPPIPAPARFRVRLLVLALAAAAIGLWIAAADPWVPLVVYCEALGVLLTVSGVLARWRYRGR